MTQLCLTAYHFPSFTHTTRMTHFLEPRPALGPTKPLIQKVPWFKRREENQLDATEWFIGLVICSTCIGHLYALHQELESILVLLPYMVTPWLLEVAGLVPHPGRVACYPAPDRRRPATKVLHTTCGNNTSIVSSSWWRAYKCPKHVDQITSAINHSVASTWFSSLRLHNDARTNTRQVPCFLLAV